MFISDPLQHSNIHAASRLLTFYKHKSGLNAIKYAVFHKNKSILPKIQQIKANPSLTNFNSSPNISKLSCKRISTCSFIFTVLPERRIYGMGI